MVTQPIELTVGQLATRCGTSVSTLRFYERHGLIAPRRTGGNQRRYQAHDMHRVALILLARAAGQTLEDIGTLLRHLPASRPPTTTEWANALTECRSALTTSIERLRRLQDETSA